MVIARALLLIAAVASCDRWREPEPLWSLDASRIGTPELDAPMRVAAGPNGTTFAVVVASRLGDRDFPGASVVRLDPAGAITAAGDGPLADVAPTAIAVDDRGRPVAVWVQQGTYRIHGYDEALAPRWTASVFGAAQNTACCTIAHQDGFAVGSAGEVAYTKMDANGVFTVHYLGDDGVERWTASPGFVDKITIVDGDVLAYVDDRRVRLAAADGAVIEDIAHPIVRAVSRAGTAVAQDSIGVGALSLIGSDGGVRWTREVDGIGRCPLGGCGPSREGSRYIAIAPNGTVFVQLFLTEQVTLDAASGDELGYTRHCGEVVIADVADDGYLVLGPTCDAPRALAKYAPPD